MLVNGGNLIIWFVMIILFFIFCNLITIFVTRVTSWNVVNVGAIFGAWIIAIFIMAFVNVGLHYLLEKPVDVIVYDDRGNYVCEYNDVSHVKNENGKLVFKYNGKNHSIDNWSCRREDD